MRSRKTMIGAAMVMCWTGTVMAQAPTYDQTFLTDYSKLQPRTAGEISDYFYLAPDAFKKLTTYKGVAVDQPEVLISPDSDYKGAKPDDLVKVAEAVRQALTERLTAGGYNVTEKPGPGILYVRLAVTDLKLKKKRRGLLAYTPIGAVVHFGVYSLRSMMENYDITGMTLQGELTDSVSGEDLAELVVPWQDFAKKKRMTFEDLQKLVNEYGARMRCQLDNAKAPAGQQINCLDPKARAAAESAKKPQ